MLAPVAAQSLGGQGGAWRSSTYVAAGEVTTLGHELRDDAVEGGALGSEAILAGRELAEVAGGIGDDVVVEEEVDAAVLLWKGVSPCCSMRGEDRVFEGRIMSTKTGVGRPFVSQAARGIKVQEVNKLVEGLLG